MCLVKKFLNMFLIQSKILILNDILKGRGQFASEWFLVILRLESNIEWVLKPINEVINFYGGEVVFSLQGSLKIGKVTMPKLSQREMGRRWWQRKCKNAAI